MTPMQRVLRQQSENRERARALLAQEERSDAEIEELRAIETRMANLEVEYRSALSLEPATETREVTSDPEKRERQELRSAASLTNYIMSAISGRQVSGAELELRQASGVGDNKIPMELFLTETRAAMPGVETRADAATVAPTTGTGVNVDPILPMIFARSVLPRLGVAMDMVPSGGFSTMTVTGALSAAAYAAGTAAESTAAVLTPQSTVPHRVSGRLTWRAEDVALVGQSNFEAINRQQLQLAMSAALDSLGLTGDNASPNAQNPRGILTQLTDPASDPSDVATFDAFVQSASDGLDAGPWAEALSDVKLLVNADTLRLAESTFQSTSTYKGEMSAASYLRQHSGGFMASSRMPDTASDIAQAIRYRAGTMGLDSVNAPRTAVMPYWSELEITDIHTDSGSATTHVTVHALVGDCILTYSQAYEQINYKVS